MKSSLFAVFIVLTGVIFAQTENKSEQIDPEKYKIITTDRPDGRYLSSRGLVQYMLRNASPQLAFNPQFTREEFMQWQNQVRDKMRESMQFPLVPTQPQPKLISKSKREGYTLEKWESYPQPGSVVPFLMLVPDGVSSQKPAPAVLCFTGALGTKETLAGEENIVPGFTPPHPEENRMAMYYAQKGIVAIAVDHPGIGESSDLERYVNSKSYDQNTLTRYLHDLGWSFMGLTAFQGQQILNWMKSCDFIDPKLIALSGHSLGTGPVMALAVLNPDISAIVFNDYLCRILEREIVTTKPTNKGIRAASGSGANIFPPSRWKWFDHPDVLASLAPRPLIITEGGATSDLDMVKKAYQIMGAEDNISVNYYPMYSDPKNRRDYVKIPEGLNWEEYSKYVNVDAHNHYFKANLAVPWLTGIFQEKH